MNLQLSTFLCLCIALAIPLLVLSTSNFDHEFDEYNYDASLRNRYPELYDFLQLAHGSPSNGEYHFLKRGADFEQILKPCNRMPASGRGKEYADCVRNRMLLMGRRKRRNVY